MDEARLKKERLSLVAGGIMVMLAQLSISANCFSLFVIPICESLGFARGVFSWCQSFLSLGGVAGALVSGKIFSRYGIVKCMRIAGIMSTSIYLIQSFASSIPQFYVIYFLIGFCNVFCTSMPLSLLIGDRFTEKRNTVIGIVMMGSGFGTSLFNRLASSFILSFGWRGAIRVLGCIMAAVSLISYFVLIKETRAGSEPSRASNGAASAQTGPSEPFFRGKRIAIAFLCTMISIAAGTFMSTLTPHLQDIGFSQNFAASVYSAAMLTMAFGKIMHGAIIDKWGVRVSNSLMIITAMIGLVGSLTFKSAWYAVLSCIGMLFISSLAVVGAPALAEALGGQRNKKFFVGKLNAFINLGYCIGPFIYGAVYDRVGTYVPMYYVALGLLGLSLAGVLILLPGKAESLAGK